MVEPTADVAAEIVAAVKIAMPETSTPQSVLAAYGTDRRVLLVLDNCEQILDQVAEVAELLTEPGRQVRLLATSRESLGIDGEAVITLGPLPVESEAADGDDTGVGPAVALFLERARIDPVTVLGRGPHHHPPDLCARSTASRWRSSWRRPSPPRTP